MRTDVLLGAGFNEVLDFGIAHPLAVGVAIVQRDVAMSGYARRHQGRREERADDVQSAETGQRPSGGYAAKGKRPSREEMAKVVRGDSPLVQRPFKGSVEVKEVPNEPETVVWDDVETKAFEDTGTFIADLQAQLGASIEGFKCAHGDNLRYF